MGILVYVDFHFLGQSHSHLRFRLIDVCDCRPKVLKLPGYRDALDLLRKKPDAVYLDMGCCCKSPRFTMGQGRLINRSQSAPICVKLLQTAGQSKTSSAQISRRVSGIVGMSYSIPARKRSLQPSYRVTFLTRV
jgi:hypothetical protein